MDWKSRLALVAVAAALYVWSIVLPAAAPFKPEFSNATTSGLGAFVVGLGALAEFDPRETDCWVLGGAWLVNPLMWFAAVASVAGRRRPTAIAALAAVVLALPVLYRYRDIIADHTAYWCWLGTAILLAAGCCPRWVARVPEPSIQIRAAA